VSQATKTTNYSTLLAEVEVVEVGSSSFFASETKRRKNSKNQNNTGVINPK
jgi:hypothetical protein